MFAQGIQLTLLVGPLVPLPVPRVVLDALQSVEVRTAAGSASGFQLTFTITARSPLNTIFLLAAGTNTGMATPPLRVLLILTMNGSAQPLFDGVMTHVEVQPGGRGQAGTLTVTGEDVTKAMDMQDFSGLPFPAVPVEGRVALLCAKYAPFGLIPMVIPVLFPDVQIPIDKIPAQKGTDLAYIQELARQVGAVYLRIDVIEQALREAGVLAGDVGASGYAVANALALSNLRLGQRVIADCVNPVKESRDAWQAVATAAGVALINIEVVCSDQQAHRRRVEGRVGDIPGLVPPTWESVQVHEYEPWEAPPFRLDTAQLTPAEAVAAALLHIG